MRTNRGGAAGPASRTRAVAAPLSAVLAAMSLLVGAAPGALAGQDRATPPPPALSGAPSPGWVGINVRVTEKTGEPALVVITDVWPGSPAEKAGIQAGDRVLRVNGVEISPRQFRSVSQRLQPGDPMSLVVERDGDRLDLTVVAEPRPARVAVAPQRLRSELEAVRGRMARILAADESLRVRADSLARTIRVQVEADAPHIVVETAEGDSIRTRVIRLDSLAAVESLVGIRGLDDQGFVFVAPDWSGKAVPDAPRAPRAEGWTATVEAGRPLAPFVAGLNRVAGAELRPMNPGLARYFEVESGLLVTAVADGTPAAEAGLLPGDVLVEVDGSPVGTVPALRQALSTGLGPATLAVIRRGERIAIRID